MEPAQRFVPDRQRFPRKTPARGVLPEEIQFDGPIKLARRDGVPLLEVIKGPAPFTTKLLGPECRHEIGMLMALGQFEVMALNVDGRQRACVGQQRAASAAWVACVNSHRIDG